MNGRTPLEAWQTAVRLRRAAEDELLFLMHSRGIYKVTGNGVSLKVWGARIGYGARNSAIQRWIGRDVFITIDPNDPSCCYAFTPDREKRRFLTRLESNEKMSPMATSDDVREGQAAVGRRRKDLHKADRESHKRTRTAVQEMNAKQRERLTELRATGTTDHKPKANLVPVQIGFELASNAIQKMQPPDYSPAADAMRRMADFTNKSEPEETRRDSTWSRLQAFTQGKSDD